MDRMHCASSSSSDWLDSPVDPGLLDRGRPGSALDRNFDHVSVRAHAAAW